MLGLTAGIGPPWPLIVWLAADWGGGSCGDCADGAPSALVRSSLFAKRIKKDHGFQRISDYSKRLKFHSSPPIPQVVASIPCSGVSTTCTTPIPSVGVALPRQLPRSLGGHPRVLLRLPPPEAAGSVPELFGTRRGQSRQWTIDVASGAVPGMARRLRVEYPVDLSTSWIGGIAGKRSSGTAASPAFPARFGRGLRAGRLARSR